MNYEQKYKDAIDRAKKELAVCGSQDCDAARQIFRLFPELKESEDERIRKEFCKDIWTFIPNEKAHKYITWLEKQREQELNDDEDILQRFSFYSYKDEPNILYLSGLYVNPKHRSKGIGTKILTIADKVAANMCCKFIRLKTEISSNAERLYRSNGYYAIKIEDNQVWLEKQGKQKADCSEEDEKIRKEIISALKWANHKGVYDKHITWLEKQGEHKSVDKVKPKFQNGQWIVWQNKCYKVNYNGCGYELIDQNGLSTSLEYGTIDENAHIWDITKDAKDGDVLANDHHILILKELAYDWSSNGTPNSVKAYCGIKPNGKFEMGKDNWCFCGTLNIHPATKEQRDILFSKMKEWGYEWDAETKVLYQL